MQYHIPAGLLGEITIFAKKNGIQKVLLFGSRARGNHSDRSDVDIAVSGGDFDSFFWDIKEQTNTLLSFDIVNLDKRISEELRKEIDRDGVILYEKDR